MKRDFVFAALAIIALIAVSLLEAHPKEAPPPYATRASDDFNSGGYRGWYDLMAREGVRVRRFRQHHDTLRDTGIDTLVVAFPDDNLPSTWNASELAALRSWVRGGGRLVDIGLWPSTGKNEGQGESVFIDERKHDDHGAVSGPWAGAVAALPQRGTDRLVAAPHKKIDTLLRDKGGALVVRYRLGRGEVIGVASALPFENGALGRGDDARLAYLAARPGRPDGVLAFDEAVRGNIVDKPWYRALSAAELVALALAALAGLLWILYGIVPLGPAIRLRVPREPTSGEFVDAVAALYERARARDHARDALVADARRSLERAPRTAANATLAKRVVFAANYPSADDAALVDVARLARTAREEIIRAAAPDRRTGASARGFGARRRRG